MLDSCHAGSLLPGVKLRDQRDATRFVNELRDAENGVVVFTASVGDQLSQESPDWGNGAFTEALLEALAGKADADADRAILISELDTYLDRRVRALTGGLQTPIMVKPSSIPNFPIALVGEGSR